MRSHGAHPGSAARCVPVNPDAKYRSIADVPLGDYDAVLACIPDEPKIATYKAKWDEDYRKRWGIRNCFARDLDPALVKKIERVCKRIYRRLALTGYARIDLRLTDDGQIVFIEANPNPILAAEEDFAQSAAKASLAYPQLIEMILALAKTTRRE